ncbi:MAG: ABC transporter permease [Clostridiaceae bacterium]|nr:ABC transporter permease [Clostridiaceae bacterium]
MQVFNAYFKVIRKNIPAMAIYLIIFFFFAFMLAMFFNQNKVTQFSAAKVRIALIQEDEGNSFSDGLADWLAGQATIVDLPDDPESLQDALFYRDVAYILRIPKGFGEHFLQGRYDIMLDRTEVPDSFSGTQMDLLVDQYLNLSALYIDSLDTIDAGRLQSSVEADLAKSAPVVLETGAKSNGTNKAAYYFIYLSYSMMAIMVLAVTSIMLVFNKPDLRKRNQSAPVNLFRFNLQLVLGHLMFALIAWLFIVLLSLTLGGNNLGLKEFLLLSLNALTFTLACLSIAFFISQFIRNRAVQQSVANVLSLGTCFISGVFVPQEMLGQTVQTIASFTPTYWYIRAVRQIDALTEYTAQTLRPVASFMLIQLGFVLAFLAISLAVIKQKRQTQA